MKQTERPVAGVFQTNPRRHLNCSRQSRSQWGWCYQFQKTVVLSTRQRQTCFPKAAKICHYGKYLLQGLSLQNIQWRRVWKTLFIVDSQLWCSSPAECCNSIKSNHKCRFKPPPALPCRRLLKCLVLPAGFSAKHILNSRGKDNELETSWEPQRQRQQRWALWFDQTLICHTNTIVLINIAAEYNHLGLYCHVFIITSKLLKGFP